MANNTFTNCHCPHCKHPLDTVAIQSPTCPQCNHPLDPRSVWLTRRYPNQIDLPWWIGLFGWPLLLMLSAIAIYLLRYHALGHLPGRGDWFVLPAEILFAVGLTRFIIKLAMKGDE